LVEGKEINLGIELWVENQRFTE